MTSTAEIIIFADKIVEKHLKPYNERWDEVLLAESTEDVPTDYLDSLDAMAIEINKYTNNSALGWWKKRKLLKELFKAMRSHRIHPIAQVSIYENVMSRAVLLKLRDGID